MPAKTNHMRLRVCGMTGKRIEAKSAAPAMHSAGHTLGLAQNGYIPRS